MFQPSEVLRAQRWRYSRLLLAFFVVVLVWGAGALGLLAPLDGPVRDVFVRLAARAHDRPAEVILVEGRDPSLEDDGARCFALARELLDHGARAVAFTWPVPDGAVRPALRRLQRVVFGRRAVRDAGASGGWRLEAGAPRLPARAGPAGPRAGTRWGVVHLEPGVRGIRRAHRLWFETPRGPRASIEAEVAALGGKEAMAGGDGRYPVFFSGPAGSLPRVDVERVLAGDVVADLFERRVAIVGYGGDRFPGPGIDTPTTEPARPMSALEFHGHALNTLLAGEQRAALSPLVRLGLLLVLGLAATVLLQLTDAGLGTWILAALVGAFTVATWVLFVYGRVWPPLPELALSQAVIFVVAVRGRSILVGGWMRSLLLAAASRLRDKQSPGTLEIRDECWPLVVNMVHQTLDLTRGLFLETGPGDSMLREVQALNCTFEDIAERRRDSRRAPYVTAVEAGGPIRVEGYLTKTYPREEQYIVPLVFGGEVLGFWVCGVDPSRSSAVPVFENVLRDYASLVSELLWQRRQARSGHAWWRKVESCLTHEREEDTYRQLKAALELLEGRLRQLERLLGGIRTATVVYDLFGRVIHINDRMLDLLEAERLQPDKMTALDLVSALSEHDLAKSRKILRNVILDQQTISLPVKLPRQQDTRWVMHLHPMQVGPHETPSDALEELSGKSVLCELVDITAFTGLFEMKEKLASRLGLQLRNDLASVDLSSSLLGSRNLSADQRQHVSQIIHEKVGKTMDVLVECQQYLALDGEVERVERFPVDSQEVFRAATQEARPVLEARTLELEVREPKLMSFVLASSENLRVVFTTILKLLAGDASEGSAVAAQIEEGEDLVAFRFSNAGFGMPDDRFQEYLFGDSKLATDELRALREAVSWVEAWGGELEAHSEVGVGTRADLRLVKFI